MKISLHAVDCWINPAKNRNADARTMNTFLIVVSLKNVYIMHAAISDRS